jgi:hypothetical protein
MMTLELFLVRTSSSASSSADIGASSRASNEVFGEPQIFEFVDLHQDFREVVGLAFAVLA